MKFRVTFKFNADKEVKEPQIWEYKRRQAIQSDVHLRPWNCIYKSLFLSLHYTLECEGELKWEKGVWRRRDESRPQCWCQIKAQILHNLQAAKVWWNYMYHLEIIWHQLVIDEVECDSLINVAGLWSTGNYESSNYIIKLIILQGLNLSPMQKQEIKLSETKCTARSLIILFKGLVQTKKKKTYWRLAMRIGLALNVHVLRYRICLWHFFLHHRTMDLEQWKFSFNNIFLPQANVPVSVHNP